MKNFEEFLSEEECWFSLKDLEEYDLTSLPENLTVLIESGFQESDSFPFTQLERKKNIITTVVSLTLDPEEFWNHKYTALQFCQGIIKGLKLVENEDLEIYDVDYQDNGAKSGIWIGWKINLPINISVQQIEKTVNQSVKIAYNSGLNYLEGLSSILILGKDTGDNLKKLKEIAITIENQGYNPIIIKEEKDLIGETVIQKVLKNSLISKFIIIENTYPSGHLYELPHISMTNKISIILQERNKGATWMVEEMYFNSQIVKKFEYENTENSLATVLEEALEWANNKFKELCEYQTKNLPWMKK